MYKKSILVFLFSLSISIFSSSMHNPVPQLVIPVEVDNRSNIVATVIYGALESNWQLWQKSQMVYPGKVCAKGFYDTPAHPDKFMLAEAQAVRITTAQGHYFMSLNVEGDHKTIVCGLATGQGWKKQNPILFDTLIKLTARIQPDGFIKLIQNKPGPQDGRPDVSLLAYEELLGTQEYASAQQILALEPGQDPKQAYYHRLKMWENPAQYSEAEGIKDLIEWAAKKLGAK